MLKKILNGLNKRKVKVFLFFLLCSFLAWTISKLSESFESRATFELAYTNLPDTLLLNTNKKDFTNAKLRASGFQFLSYRLDSKEIKVDLSQVRHRKYDYFLTKTALKVQLEKQLSNTVSLLELEKDTFFVDLYKVAVKEVPIVPNITLELAANHILDGELAFNPKTVTIKGPSKEIDGINEISTVPLVLNGLTEGFSENLELIVPESLDNAVLLENNIQVSAKVVEFSEKEFNIPINSINVPKGFKMKNFPNNLTLVCKASIANLKTMKPSDFEAIVNYDELADPSSKFLNIKLKRTPKNVYSVQLMANQVEFVLERI